MFGGNGSDYFWEFTTAENPEFTCKYFFDTSNSYNFMHKSIALKVGAKKINPLSVSYIKCKDGYEESFGHIWINLKIGGTSFPIKFNLVNELTVPAKIGTLFARKHIDSIGGGFTNTIFMLNTNEIDAHYLKYIENEISIKDIRNYIDEDDEPYVFEDDGTDYTFDLSRDPIKGSNNTTGKNRESGLVLLADLKNNDLEEKIIVQSCKIDTPIQAYQKVILTKGKLPFIELGVVTDSENKIRFLIDTGSTVNLIRYKEAFTLGVVKIDLNDKISLIGIGNIETRTMGSFWIELVIDNVIFPTKFHVVEELLVPGLIGGEFLQQHVQQIGQGFEYIMFQRDVNKSFNPRNCNTITEQIPIFQGLELNEIFDNEENFGTLNELEDDEWINLNTKMLDLDKNIDCDIMDYKNKEMLQGAKRQAELLKLVKLGHLSQDNNDFINSLILKFSDIFYLEGDNLTYTDIAVHEIETLTNIPIYKRQYRFPETIKAQINEQIDEMLEQGIIKPSKSPWNAPVLCVPKKPDEHGKMKYRVVVDFRSLNTITKPFVYPIPLINEILDNLGDSKYFSTLDLKSGFYQVPIDPRDAAKTAFSTPKGHFEFTRMPMGLKNSPSTFQKLMNTVLYEIGDARAVVYLDDVIISGRTIAEHNENLFKVLNGIRKHNLKLEPTKCQFLKEEIKYLGHIINKDGIKPTKDNVESIKKMKRPSTVKDVRSFLGTINFYAKFIPNVAEKRKPLNELLKKDVKFKWTENCEKAFNDLRCFLTSEPLLVRPKYDDVFVITTDASNHAIGAILSNEKTVDRPIAFASRALIDTEKRYHIIEKELLAIVWAVEYFRHYIFGQKFIIYTDHRPLISIWRLKETSTTLTRLRLKLQGLDCDIRYKQGKENIVADFLSRLTYDDDSEGSNTQRKSEENVAQIKHIVAVVTRNQLKQLDQNEGKGTNELHNDPNLRQTDAAHLDDICNVDISMEQADDRNGESNKANEQLFDVFMKKAKLDTLNTGELTFTKTEYNIKAEANLLILNNKSAFKEISTMRNMPHGIKDYVNEGILCIPKDKIIGIILDGKSNSLINSRIFFNNINKCFAHGPDFLKNAEKIHITSFRKIRQYEVLQMIQFVGKNYNKHISLYNADSERIQVEESEIETILHEFHDAPLGGHVGAKRMKKRISTIFSWKNMKRDVENYVKQCDSCQKNKIGKFNKIPMKITTTATEPFEKLFMDIVVLPESEWGNKYGLVIQDDLTRYLIVACMENQEAQTVAKTFVENVICKFGSPQELVTDQGTNFMSSLMKNICKILKIKKLNTSAYHPQANLVERSNRELKTYLRQFVGEKPRIWDQLIPYFTFEYNTTLNSSTNFTPFELLYGRQARIPTSIYNKNNSETNYFDYCNEMKSIFQSLHSKAKENLIISKEKRKRIYDTKSNEWKPMWGDLVLVQANPTGVGQKLQNIWRGPYTVLDIPSEQTAIIQNGRKIEKIHVNRLKKYND